MEHVQFAIEKKGKETNENEGSLHTQVILVSSDKHL